MVFKLSKYNHPSYRYDDVIKWKHFPRYWHFVWGIHRSPVNSPNKGQWRRALMFSLIWAWVNGWVNNHAAGDFRRHRVHYDITVMVKPHIGIICRMKVGQFCWLLLVVVGIIKRLAATSGGIALLCVYWGIFFSGLGRISTPVRI